MTGRTFPGWLAELEAASAGGDWLDVSLVEPGIQEAVSRPVDLDHWRQPAAPLSPPS